MHVLFVHQNFPAQFGHIASHLTSRLGWRCTFVSERPAGQTNGVERIQYKPRGGATPQTHFCSRTFENATWHAHAVYGALKARPDIKPDLIVGHSGFGSTLFLRELYDCPIINYFEWFYRSTGGDMGFRPDFPSRELDRLRAKSRNAMILLDLENCDAGYCPTKWQRSRFPDLVSSKLRVIFDGIDTELWKPIPDCERTIGEHRFPEDVKIVTYVSRGMESMRGFDIFMKMARRLSMMRKDVLFVIAGRDRVCYGGDERFTGQKSFKEWVLSQGGYDLSRFVFLDLVPTPLLPRLFAISDLHVYLTVPFVLSWSLMDALACEATVLASDTEPVREMIVEGKTGLLADFFNVEEFAERANRVLNSPREYKHLGKSGAEMIKEHYSLDVCLPQMIDMMEEVAKC